MKWYWRVNLFLSLFLWVLVLTNMPPNIARHAAMGLAGWFVGTCLSSLRNERRR